jgi:cytochrome P450
MAECFACRTWLTCKSECYIQGSPVIPHPEDFSVTPPCAPFYDDSVNSTVFSRYEDVHAALCHPGLQPGSSVKEVPESSRTMAEFRSRTQDALSQPQLNKWKSCLEKSAQGMIADRTLNGPFDLMKDCIRPWTLHVAFQVTHANPSQTKRLCELAGLISAAAAEPRDEDLKIRGRLADQELQQLFRDPLSPVAGPAFVALSQTLAALLSNGWVALLQHPKELALLHRSPDLAGAAVEEFLRFCAVPRTLSRVAISDTNISGVTIPCGGRVVLEIASANRDPNRFADPNRLVLSRRAGGHFALGAGLHACVGASLIRMTMEIATRAFARAVGSARLRGPVEWRGGSGFRWPNMILLEVNQ